MRNIRKFTVLLLFLLALCLPALCAQADEVCVFEPVYSGGCMLRRNRAMVDAARRVITVYDGGEGGTAYTVRYARQTGRQIVALWQ